MGIDFAQNFVVPGDGVGISDERLLKELTASIEKLKPSLKKVLLLPPDYTRFHSCAGKITRMLYNLLQDSVQVDIMPALGTHEPMSKEECIEFFGPDVPFERVIVHDWRNDVVKLGEVPGSFVSEVSEGLMTEPIAVEVNKRIVDKSYDLIVSIGQVVPHEVVGMANHNKNIFVGCGGSNMINSSHMTGAFYGMERMMGRDNTPVRKIFDYAEKHYLADVPLVYMLTVTTAKGMDITMHGLFIGKGRKGFEEAVSLAQKKNLILLDKKINKAVVYLDEKEFKSTWLGNKSVYRTRMAMADGGELIVLAPGVAKFGEDKENDRLIRKYGYVGRMEVLKLFKENEDLQQNQSVPAHLIHGSSDGRFSITYATQKLTKAEVEGAAFKYMPYDEAVKRYDPAVLKDGFNTLPDGEEVFYVSNPALGLWAFRGNFE